MMSTYFHFLSTGYFHDSQYARRIKKWGYIITVVISCISIFNNKVTIVYEGTMSILGTMSIRPCFSCKTCFQTIQPVPDYLSPYATLKATCTVCNATFFYCNKGKCTTVIADQNIASKNLSNMRYH